MKKGISGVILLIGVYALLKNNVGLLPEGPVWAPSPDVFYKLAIPLLMIASAGAAFACKKIRYFLLSLGALCVDAVNRLAAGVNYIALCQWHGDLPQAEPLAGTVVITVSLWPSLVILFIEAAMIYLALRCLRKR